MQFLTKYCRPPRTFMEKIMKIWRASLCLTAGLLASSWACAQSAEAIVKSAASSSADSSTALSQPAETKSTAKAERREAHRRLRVSQRHRIK